MFPSRDHGRSIDEIIPLLSLRKLDMTLCYFHNPAQRIVYRCKSEPDVIENTVRGKVVGWHVALSVDVTRADNWFEKNGQWHYKVTEIRTQDFMKPMHKAEQVTSFFKLRNWPENWGAIAIDEITYHVLQAEYETTARNSSSLR